MRRLSVNAPRKALLTIYQSFIRPHLDYGDILYDKPETITGAIQGTSRQRLYDELGLHSLSKRRWHNKLAFLCKILN